MYKLLLPSSLAALAGVSIVIQQAVNTSLRTQIQSAAWAGAVSYVGGLVCMLIFILVVRDPTPSASLVARVPWWAWSGGVFGALFIGLAILLVPQLGAATFIALLVAGQMTASVAFDHFGWLGLAQRSLDLPRALGMALLIGGVVLVRR